MDEPSEKAAPFDAAGADQTPEPAAALAVSEPAHQTVAIDETDRLIASDKVAGTAVYGRGDERIGEIYNFMVDKVSGQVAYAVMAFGGFLGLGEQYFPLPWRALSYDPDRGGYRVDLDKDALKDAPRFALGDHPWKDPVYGAGIRDYYGLKEPL